jgi:sugar phosphate isomerase/epimerase
MKSRRSFLKTTAILAAGSLIFPSDIFAARKRTVGLQLYTLRNDLGIDLNGTLKKISELGYNCLEAAGYKDRKYYGMKAKDFKALVNSMGMILPSTHLVAEKPLDDAPLDIMLNMQAAVDDAAELGVKYLVYAYLRPEERKSMEDYKRYAEQFNKAGEICKKAGIQFAYHNHDFEFAKFDGLMPYDLLLKDTDPPLVKMELDLYWITKAGYSPLEYFKSNPGRFKLWHVKDMDNTPDKKFTEVGNGTINFQLIFDAAKQGGMEYFFVEQDKCKGTPLESIKASFDNLKKIKF